MVSKCSHITDSAHIIQSRVSSRMGSVSVQMHKIFIRKFFKSPRPLRSASDRERFLITDYKHREILDCIPCVMVLLERKHTNGQTDGRTDGRYQTYYLPCFAVDKKLFSDRWLKWETYLNMLASIPPLHALYSSGGLIKWKRNCIKFAVLALRFNWKMQLIIFQVSLVNLWECIPYMYMNHKSKHSFTAVN